MKKFICSFLFITFVLCSVPVESSAIQTLRTTYDDITELCLSIVPDDIWVCNGITNNSYIYTDIESSPICMDVMADSLHISIRNGFCDSENIEYSVFNKDNGDVLYKSVYKQTYLTIPNVDGSYHIEFESYYSDFICWTDIIIENGRVYLENDIYADIINDCAKYVAIIKQYIDNVVDICRVPLTEKQIIQKILQLRSVPYNSYLLYESEYNDGTTNADNLYVENIFNYNISGYIEGDTGSSTEDKDTYKIMYIPFSGTFDIRLENKSQYAGSRLKIEVFTSSNIFLGSAIQQNTSSDITLQCSYDVNDFIYIRVSTYQYPSSGYFDVYYEYELKPELSTLSALTVLRGTGTPTFPYSNSSNCYGYAVGTGDGVDPGYYSSLSYNANVTSLVYNFREDCATKTGSYPISIANPNTYSGSIPTGTYLLALFSSSNPFDYHFYVQQVNGTWRHYRYSAPSSTDKNGKIIYHPLYCSRSYSSAYYDNFIGYYLIKSYE